VTGSWVVGNARDITTANIQKGLQWTYHPAAATYRCPADPGKCTDGITPRTRGYSLSVWLGQKSGGPYSRWETQKSPQLRRTSTVYGFVCENEGSIEDGAFGVYPPNLAESSTWLSLPSNRHGGGGVLSFADGHVEYWKWHPGAAMAFKGRPQSATTAELPDLQRFEQCVPDPST